MSVKKIQNIINHKNADGILPGIHGQRSFPQPGWEYPDPFLLLDHIGPQKVDPRFSVDGHPHPHRGFETVTMMFSGFLDHLDSIGTRVKLETGGIQLMNAGSGIIHGGKMGVDPTSGEFNEIQLWINVPRSLKMSAPFVKSISSEDIPTVEGEGWTARLFAGSYLGKVGPVETSANTLILHGAVRQGSEIVIEDISSQFNSMVYVLKGGLFAGETQISPYQLVAYSSEGSHIKLHASEDSEFLVLAGEPLNEPMVMGGPFVMSDSKEIEDAYSDYKAGKFGQIV